jgi:hypothetical protein
MAKKYTADSVEATSFTGSLFGTSSWAENATTASQANNATTASYYNGSITSASYAQTASVAPAYLPLTGGTLTGGLTAPNLTAQFNVTVVSGSQFIMNNPANTNYYTLYTDSSNVLNFGLGGTNPKATLSAVGNLTASGSITGTYIIKAGGTSTQYLMADGTVTTFPTSFTGSLQGTASYAVTASYALNGGGGAAFPYTGSALITGSLGVTGSTIITGSLRGNVSALSIASNTASLNLTTNNFFTINLVNGANTHISASDIQPGQTINLRVSQSSAGTGTVSFNSLIEQASGSLYTGSMIANAEDIVTFISFDSSRLYMSALRNLI